MKEMTIELRNISIYARHGCYDEERIVGGQFIVDADIRIDATRPAKSDDIHHALNYVDVCLVIKQVMDTPHHLLESLVEDITHQLRQQFTNQGLLGGWVRVRKIAPPIGVEIESVGVRGEI